jgi:uncharacterized protein YjbI with pentapeptide repeats
VPTSPRSPRIPTGLATIADWSPDEGVFVSDSLLSGDFSRRSQDSVTFERCRICNAAFIGATLDGLRLRDVVVENTDLSGAVLDMAEFTRVWFRDCRMSGVILTRCNFRDVTATDCRFDRANLRMSTAKSLTFDDVDLRLGDFYGAVLEDTMFFDSDLAGCDFSQASTTAVRFHGSNLLDLKGGHYLGGSVIETSQVLPIALGILSALDIQIDDDREPEANNDRLRRKP